ncbi:uncharacterized protein LOC107269566 [Cephus cinctus]|uniref:Uncharacterized protein LOC107269566 n=1 Tax=Cephus cinctus TaxID=211228 RepID=A0AAJ7FMG2_CEPCN|nr:uncharacterized protein LOC107269566 [Cephus cinctus]
MCHETDSWVDTLPMVLLGLRTSIKEDLKASAAELVYGTYLRIPGEFLTDSETTDEHPIYSQKLRRHARAIRPVATAHHNKKKAFTHKTLHSCSHVFLRMDQNKRVLEQPYEGPFEVAERLSDTVYIILINGKRETVSTERLKPAFLERIPGTDEMANSSLQPASSRNSQDHRTEPADAASPGTSQPGNANRTAVIPVDVPQPTSRPDNPRVYGRAKVRFTPQPHC